VFGRQYSKDEADTVRPNPTPITMNKTKIDSAMSIRPKKNPSYPSQGRNKYDDNKMKKFDTAIINKTEEEPI